MDMSDIERSEAQRAALAAERKRRYVAACEGIVNGSPFLPFHLLEGVSW